MKEKAIKEKMKIADLTIHETEEASKTHCKRIKNKHRNEKEQKLEPKIWKQWTKKKKKQLNRKI